MIDNSDRHFKGQLKDEEVLAFCRKHWVCILPHLGIIVFMWPVILIYAFFVAPFFLDLFGKTGYQIFSLILVAGLTFALHRVFLRIFNYYLNIFIITNLRIVDLKKTVFFEDSKNAIDIKEIQDCTVNRSGLLQTVLNYGEIQILLSSVTEPIVMKYMPNPDYHFRKINKTKREYISFRQGQKIEREHVSLEPKPDILTGAKQYPLTNEQISGKSGTG